MTDPTELLASVSSAALRTSPKQRNREAKKPPQPNTRPSRAELERKRKRKRGRRPVARSDTSDEDDAGPKAQDFSPDPFSAGGYRFKDLQSARIVTNRTDLNRKQRELGFPHPIKTGTKQAWWPKSEVHSWLKKRAALRATTGGAR